MKFYCKPCIYVSIKICSQGTSRPTHYHVLLDEIGFSPDDLQELVHSVSYVYGVSPFTPLKGLFIQGPVFISFFLAITNMAEKMPSFKHGGALWFADLSTPDALYIFPVLTALSFLVVVECIMQEGMEGNPVAGTMKNFSRVLALLSVPFTMSFPKGAKENGISFSCSGL
ncbi:mitochondrial inner membrane protein OXA1-like [Trifolium pratense]|uniref:mitochondrial inner membrane protein OXA1-like n=1 Tax=Trifolium pratense TaxID=57577 RepID=UPI001E697923|nr:mitochondrial inner membrane protein OXA1-like [Trifolium pratense]XP_045802088.1 mitochondrial inner membrane protein OXA1-like [Trifolium pratense]XP_045802089.1 mitochondrial inner membrane protein OXA1-like [Trifolium pratense]